MSFTGLRYDNNAYEADLQISTAPARRILDPVYANVCNPCRPAQPGWLGRNGVSTHKGVSLVDIESDLNLRNYPASRDPAMKFIPICPKCQNCQTSGYPCGSGVTAGCDCCQGKLNHVPECSELSTEYNRLTNPPSTLKGKGINRFDPLYLNPQDENRWLHPAEVGINYRMIVKDNHIPKVPNVQLAEANNRQALPDPANMDKEIECPTAKVCSSFTGPMHSTYKNLNRHWNHCAPYTDYKGCQ